MMFSLGCHLKTHRQLVVKILLYVSQLACILKGLRKQNVISTVPNEEVLILNWNSSADMLQNGST